MDFFLLVALAIIVILVGLLLWLWQDHQSLQNNLSSLAFSKSSQSVRYGKLSEQWIPLSQSFPYDSHTFRFLGSPIDGVAFTEDKIVFCEFKANKSQLSEKQKHIKKLVDEKKVEWLQIQTD